MPACSACGSQVEDTMVSCPSCGQMLDNSERGHSSAWWSPPPRPELAPFQTPATNAIDLNAIAKIRQFAIIQIISYVAVLVVGSLFFVEVDAFRPAFGSISDTGSLQLPPVSAFIDSLGVLVLSGIIYLFGLYELRSGFKTLTQVDDVGFGWSAVITLALLFEVPVTLLGIIVVFYGSAEAMFVGYDTMIRP
jgi:hypothetical protein